jgi:hypothetical protein
MEVDAGAVARRQVEDHVEVAHGIAVHARGIDATDRLHTGPERLLQQLGGAGIDQ